jgi:hypothetical protein
MGRKREHVPIILCCSTAWISRSAVRIMQCIRQARMRIPPNMMSHALRRPLQGDWQPSGVMTVSEAAPASPPGAFANFSPYSGVSRVSGSPFRGAPTHSPLQEHVSQP